MRRITWPRFLIGLLFLLLLAALAKNLVQGLNRRSVHSSKQRQE